MKQESVAELIGYLDGRLTRAKDMTCDVKEEMSRSKNKEVRDLAEERLSAGASDSYDASDRSGSPR